MQVWQMTDPGTHLVSDTLGSGERDEPHPQHTFPFQGMERTDREEKTPGERSKGFLFT